MPGEVAMSNGVRLRSYIDETARLRDRALWVALGGLGLVVLVVHILDAKANTVAFAASEAKGIQHNGLIERMREMAARYITRETVIAFLSAIGIFTALYVAFLKP